jgi:ABC-type transport system substrate-binding protein
MLPRLLSLVVAIGGVAAALLPVEGQTPKRGGILTSMIIEDPPGFSIHESATVSTVWPMMPCYSNLVIFDQAKPQETIDTVVPELAERWSWQDNHRNLVFFLRKNVKWHDGKPFTSKDVKHTFDVVREAPDTSARFRLSPAQGLVRERRRDRGAGRAHGHLSAQAAPAVAAPHARRRILAGVSRAYLACRPAPAMRGHGPVQAQGVRPRAIRRPRAEPRTTSFRTGRTWTASAT